MPRRRHQGPCPRVTRVHAPEEMHLSSHRIGHADRDADITRSRPQNQDLPASRRGEKRRDLCEDPRIVERARPMLRPRKPVSSTFPRGRGRVESLAIRGSPPRARPGDAARSTRPPKPCSRVPGHKTPPPRPRLEGRAEVGCGQAAGHPTRRIFAVTGIRTDAVIAATSGRRSWQVIRSEPVPSARTRSDGKPI